MKIASYDEGVEFNLYNELITELSTYGVIAEGNDGMCEIINPIYHYCIMQAFKPPVNGLEQEYHPEDTRSGFQDYLTPDGQIPDESTPWTIFGTSSHVQVSRFYKCQILH